MARRRNQRRRSHMPQQSRFSTVPGPRIPRSTFNRTSTLKTTVDAGRLYPVFADEALPGDTFNMRCDAFGRLATPIHPIMDNLFVDIHFWAVPNRLVWDNWQKFCGERTNPDDDTDFIVPFVQGTVGGFQTGSLADYFGIPVGQTVNQVNALHFRAYNLIWNEFYRAQDIQDSAPVQTGNGPDTLGLYGIRRRGKRHDYFTSCLPWPQKGDAVEISLGDTAPIVGNDPLTITSGPTEGPTYFIDGQSVTFGKDTDTGPQSIQAFFDAQTGVSNAPERVNWDDPNLQVDVDQASNWEVDLSSAQATTVDDFRQAVAVQHILERDARTGTRYTEILQGHFSVSPPDFRLQRPEFLGGGTMPVGINAVPQTSSTDETTPQGNLSAFGTVGGRCGRFVKSFEEHCVILGLVSIRADLTYQQGLHKMWTRQTRLDYYWPDLANLSEQAVLNREIYYQADDGPNGDENEEVFGYQPRYEEYRYKPSMLTASMRSTATTGTPLDTWHLAQQFDELPTLSPEFIQEDPPVDRCLAVINEPHFLLDVQFSLITARPMPTFAVPGLRRL